MNLNKIQTKRKEKKKKKHKNNKKLIIVIIILSHKQIWIVWIPVDWIGLSGMNLWKRFDWNNSISIHSKYVICGFIYEKSKLHSQNTIKEWIQ